MRRRVGDLGRNGDGYCNLVYIDDVVEAVARALRQAELGGRTFNLSLPQPPTWNEYFIRYAKALDAVPVRRITNRRLKLETRLLAPPLKILQILAQRISPRAFRGIPAPIPPSAAQLFRQEIRLSVRAAELEMGLCWTALNDGLGVTARAYRETRAQV